MSKEKNDLKAFVSQSIADIKAGLPDGYELGEEIEFEVSVLTSSGKDGKLNVKVVEVGGKTEATYSHKMKFTIANPAQQEKNAMSSVKQVQNLITAFIVSLKENAESLNTEEKPKLARSRKKN